MAETLDCADMLTAEYVAITKIQTDAFVALDKTITRSVKGIVPLASIDELTRA